MPGRGESLHATRHTMALVLRASLCREAGAGEVSSQPG